MTIVAGSIMVTIGLILFYSIQINHDTEPIHLMLNHAGTFVGLLGVGVSIAGVLLYLFNYGRNV